MHRVHLLAHLDETRGVQVGAVGYFDLALRPVSSSEEEERVGIVLWVEEEERVVEFEADWNALDAFAVHELV